MIVLPFFSALLLIGLILWLQPKGHLKVYYWVGLGLKISCGWILGWIYIIHLQTGDTYFFHQEAIKLFDVAGESHSEYFNLLFTANYPVFKGEARTELFVKLVSVLYLLSNGSYFFTSLVLACFSFFSAWHLVRVINQYFEGLTLAATVAFLFLPSMLFWTSGVLKDSIIFTAICYLLSICIAYESKRRFSALEILLTAIFMLLLFYLKFYLFAVTALLMATLAWYTLLERLVSEFSARLLIFSLFFLFTALLVSQANFNLNFENLPYSIYENQKSYGQKADFSFEHLKPTYSSLLIHLPIGLITGLFRPMLWETTAGQLVFSLESTLILILIGFSGYHFKYWRINRLVVLGLLYVLILASILPLTTPNFGTLIRYRAAYMPILTFLLLIPTFQRILSKD